MQDEERQQIQNLIEALKKTNNELSEPVNEEIIKQILFLAIKFPLLDDRLEAQNRIHDLLIQSYGGKAP